MIAGLRSRLLLGTMMGTFAMLPGDGLPAGPSRLLLGPLVGDVTADAATVWVCGADTPRVELAVQSVRMGTTQRITLAAPPDGGVCHRFSGLEPGADYDVFAPTWARQPLRRFRTAPGSEVPIPVTIAASGDIGGQGMGRDLVEGLPICAAITARRPDVFVGLGDMIYGDRSIPRTSRLGNEQLPLQNGLLPRRADYVAHWRYLHGDLGFSELLGGASYVACWDDHECCNNFGPGDSWGLLDTALTAMLDWNPVCGPPEDQRRLYRRLAHGRHVELFVLDCRSYRARADLPDVDPEPKSMLGEAQRQWLLAALAESRATWKVLVSSVPLTAPTGDRWKGRDGWSNHDSDTGYERELLELLRAMQQLGIQRPLFLCADVHHAEVLELTPFPEDPDFRPLEIVLGPMNAGCFGREVLDPTLHPTSLYYLPPDPPPVTLAQAKRYWNFGLLQFAANGDFALEVVDAFGEVRFRRTWEPVDDDLVGSSLFGADAPAWK